MYCKKCKVLLNEYDEYCPNCHTKATDVAEKQDELENITPKDQRKRPQKIKKTIFFLIIILTLSFSLCYYLYQEDETIHDQNVPNSTSTTLKGALKFKIKDIQLTYPKTFGSSTNTIFYKTNTAIYITFQTIDDETYNDYINGNDCLDSKLGNIATKTYAGDNFYSHLFLYKDTYYNITVNYSNDSKIYTQTLQSEINQILNSIEEK